MLTGSLIDPCLANFLVHPRTTWPGAVLPMVGWALLHQFAIKTTSHRHTHWPIWSEQLIPQLRFRSQMTLGWIKWTVNTNKDRIYNELLEIVRDQGKFAEPKTGSVYISNRLDWFLNFFSVYVCMFVCTHVYTGVCVWASMLRSEDNPGITPQGLPLAWVSQRRVVWMTSKPQRSAWLYLSIAWITSMCHHVQL